MTTLEEFYKVGPGPSSSHTIGPMRITYDFYQRCTKLPADQLAKVTGMKVHLYGSLSATGKGHGTERAALAGIIGKEPATVDPLFLDSLSVQARSDLPGEDGRQDLHRLAKDIIYDSPKGNFPHPNTMTCKLMGGDAVLLRARVLLGRRRVHRVEGLSTAEERPAEVPVLHDEGTAGSMRTRTSSRRPDRHGQRSGGFGQERGGDNAFIDKITNAMVNIVKAGTEGPESTLPGPIKLKTKAGEVYKRAMEDRYQTVNEDWRSVGVCLCGIGRERARPSRNHGAHRRIRGRPSRAGLRPW